MKGKIKNLANGDVRKAETLMRIFFMERFYDVYMIVLDVDFSWDILKEAFRATCQKRSTDYSDERVSRELELIDKDAKLEADWNKFKKKNFFAETLEWRTVIDSIEDSIKKVVS